MPRQNCAVCAWRENCNKRFCVSDGGARCPDFTRDIGITNADDDAPHQNATNEPLKQ